MKEARERVPITFLAVLTTSLLLLYASEASSQHAKSDLDALREEFERKMTAAGREIESLRSILDAVLETLDWQGTVIERLERYCVAHQIARFGNGNANIATAKEQLQRPKHDEDPVQVAFSVASHQNFGPVEVDTNVPYEVVYSNVADGWGATTNAFQAPVAGFYQFTASMTAANQENASRCNILHVSGPMWTTVATMVGRVDGASSAANSAILELEQGDIVSVQLRGGEDRINSNPTNVYSTFSGLLLFWTETK